MSMESNIKNIRDCNLIAIQHLRSNGLRQLIWVLMWNIQFETFVKQQHSSFISKSTDDKKIVLFKTIALNRLEVYRICTLNLIYNGYWNNSYYNSCYNYRNVLSLSTSYSFLYENILYFNISLNKLYGLFLFMINGKYYCR